MAILTKEQRQELRSLVAYESQDREDDLMMLGKRAETALPDVLDTIDSLELLVSKLLQHLRICDIPEHVLTLIVKQHFAAYNYNPYEDQGYND